MKPQTRRSGLLIRELPDELLVYDQDRHSAHCLNRTAALVFQRADGTRTVDDLARALDPAAGLDAVSAVTMALAQLAGEGLLVGEMPPPNSGEGLTRRDVARRFGLAAAIVLPAVATVLAPTPAEAAATCERVSCAGKQGSLCSGFGANPCTNTCVTNLAGSCDDGSGI